MITHYVNEIVRFMTDDFLPQYLVQLNIPKQEEWSQFITENKAALDPQHLPE